MARNRKSSPPPEPAPATDAQGLAERLAALEKRVPEDDGLGNSPAADRVRAERAWVRDNTRRDAAEPCPCCGVAGGEQHLTTNAMNTDPLANVRTQQWVCTACCTAADPGWGTNRRPRLPDAVIRDRMASAALGIEVYDGLTALGARYGLGQWLYASKAPQGPTGTAWGHLDLPAWREVARKAAVRAEAGMGPLPAFTAEEIRQVVDPKPVPSKRYVPQIRTWWPTTVPADPETPSAEDRRARLEAEEQAAEQVVKAQRRAAKEAEARADEVARIEEAYRAKKAQFDVLTRRNKEAEAHGRAALRALRAGLLARVAGGAA